MMKIKKPCIFPIVYFLLHIFLFDASAADVHVLDRVVAVVDDQVVMLSEFNDAYHDALQDGIEITHQEVLDGLINRMLLLRQAKKIKKKSIFTAITKREENVLINEYIEQRIKAFIRIPFDDIEKFYLENREFFGSEHYYDVRDEIEKYLTEKELNVRLVNHIEELREKAYIRNQLRRARQDSLYE